MALNLVERERLESYLLAQRVPARVLRARQGKLSPELLTLIQRGAREHPNAKVRRACLGVLDHQANDESGEVFRAALFDPVPHVRVVALHGLACERCRVGEVRVRSRHRSHRGARPGSEPEGASWGGARHRRRGDAGRPGCGGAGAGGTRRRRSVDAARGVGGRGGTGSRRAQPEGAPAAGGDALTRPPGRLGRWTRSLGR
jgi:hypothetical protein